jgi:protein-L-isoaspartate O-methyltransferase
VCATIVQALAPKAGDQVLVCGVKGGFTAALCAAIVGPSGRVECLETDGAIAEHARASLDRAGFDERRVRVHVVKDVTIGRDAPQRWDVAVVNGKIPKVPRSIIKQMADGGRLLIFLQDGEERGQTAYLIQMDGKAIKNTALSSFVFTPIYGEFGFDPPNWQENLQLVGASTHDAFISFSSRDEVTARAIVDEFERSGVRCWMSCRDLATASHLSTDGYAQAIMSAIREAALFVVLLSHESLESPHVKNELGQATDQKKLMLPIRLEACPPRLPDSFQYHLNRHQTVDLARQPMSEGVRHALALLGWSSPAPVAPAPTGRTIDDPPTDAEPPRSETITIEKSPHEHAEAFRSQLAAAVADGHLTQQELDALCALAMGTGTAKDLQSARSMVIAQARVLAPSVVIDDELSL